MKSTLLTAALIALAAAVPPTADATSPITLTARAGGLKATGLNDLRAGFTRVTVRNTTDEPHGVLLLRLRRSLTTAQVIRAVEANDPERSKPLFTNLGGIQAVAPGGSWEMTLDLTAGRYIALDYGDSGKPKTKRFEVGPGTHGAPPKTVGRLTLADYAFSLQLPKPFSGKGVVEIPNLGSEWHEISLVRTPAGKTAQDVLDLVHAGPQAPPPGYDVSELLWVLDPGRTAYVRFDLPPGHYVALCLIAEPRTQKLHADLGMIDEFDVS